MQRRRYGYRPNRPGLQRALQHIREAEELSRELGGTDADVKEHFYSLSMRELYPILNEYERDYGKAAREYAEQTIPAWRSGSRKMSGQNAARLFKLLPRFMPLERKYALVESLWEKLGPRSEYSIAFGRNAEARQVGDVVGQHVLATVNSHTIPEPLQRRFEWLADGDAQLMQQLLNHFLMRDREQAITTVGAQVAMILREARAGAVVRSFRRELRIGRHTVHVFLDPRATEVTVSAGSPRYRAATAYLWIVPLCVIAAVALLTLLLRHR